MSLKLSFSFAVYNFIMLAVTAFEFISFELKTQLYSKHCELKDDYIYKITILAMSKRLWNGFNSCILLFCSFLLPIYVEIK